MEDEFAQRMNSLPKYVVSSTLQEATWNSTIIIGDVASKIAELKQQPGQYILKYGTGPLDRLLMENNLVETTPFKTGMVVLRYAPTS